MQVLAETPAARIQRLGAARGTGCLGGQAFDIRAQDRARGFALGIVLAAQELPIAEGDHLHAPAALVAYFAFSELRLLIGLFWLLRVAQIKDVATLWVSRAAEKTPRVAQARL